MKYLIERASAITPKDSLDDLLKNKNSLQEIIELLENSNISKLDISRIYKYLSVIKYGKIIDDYVLT